MNALGTNPAALSRILGISDSTVRNYTDRTSKPGYEVLEKLYRSFKRINLPWLFGEPGEPLLPEQSSERELLIVQKENQGNVIGTNHGTVTHTHNTVADCEKDLKIAQTKVEHLTSQLQDKERIIQLLEVQLHTSTIVVMVGQLLEVHLRQLAAMYDISKTGDTNTSSTRLNADLAKAGVYSIDDQQQIDEWISMRNQAIHNPRALYMSDQIQLMYHEVLRFINRTSK